jgi:hypothetical protein
VLLGQPPLMIRLLGRLAAAKHSLGVFPTHEAQLLDSYQPVSQRPVVSAGPRP